MEEGGDGAHSLLTFPAEFAKPLPKFFDGKDGQREDNKGDDGQLPILVKDNTGQGEDGKDVLE
jgi:hypothetical protein